MNIDYDDAVLARDLMMHGATEDERKLGSFILLQYFAPRVQQFSAVLAAQALTQSKGEEPK